jgi:hypothetical protein
MKSILSLTFLLAPSVLAGGFHILYEDCVDTQKNNEPDGAHLPDTIVRYRTSRLIPSSRWGDKCNYLFQSAGELNQNILNEQGADNAKNFCGANLNLYKKNGGVEVYFNNGDGTLIETCYKNSGSFDCSHKTPVSSLECKYSDSYVCPSDRLC